MLEMIETGRGPAWVGPRGKAGPEDGVGGSAARANRLVGVRESAEYGWVQFDAMRHQTYEMLKGNPEIDAIAALGMEPMRAGVRSVTVKRVMASGAVELVDVPIERRKFRDGWLIRFEYAGTHHVWGGLSAVKTTESGRNEYTDFLCETVEMARPVEVVAAQFSRLIRSQRQANRVADAFDGNVDLVRAGGIDIPLAGPNAATGWMLFQVLAMVASMEREWIIARLQAGKVAQWRRGEWPLGPSTVPFGYRYNSSTKTLEVVEELIPAVGEMLAILATDAAPRAMVEQLADVGVTTMRRHRRLGKRVPLSVTGNPSSHIDRLFSWVPLWTSGEYLYRLPNVTPGIAAVAGAPVVRSGEDDLEGELQLLYKVPLPESGWASPSVLEAVQLSAMRWSRDHAAKWGLDEPRPVDPWVLEQSAAPALVSAIMNPSRSMAADLQTVAQRAARTGHAKRTLLSGWTWTDSDWRYQLRVHRSGVYRLFRYPRQAAELAWQEDE